MIKGIYFDFGGVLTPGGESSIFKEVTARYFGLDPANLAIDDLEQSLQNRDITVEEFFKYLSARYNPGGAPLTEEIYMQNADIFEPNELMYDFAAILRSMNIATGILSNVTTINSHLLRKSGAYEGFDPIVLSCDVGVLKPDKKIYEVALRLMGFSPKEVLVIDDKAECVKPAQELGAQTILAKNTVQVLGDIRNLVTAQNGAAL